MEPEPSSIVAWIGIDWADQEHHVRLQAVGSEQVEAVVVPLSRVVQYVSVTHADKWTISAIEAPHLGLARQITTGF